MNKIQIRKGIVLLHILNLMILAWLSYFFLIIKDNPDYNGIIVYILLSILLIPPIFITITYLLIEKSQTYYIDNSTIIIKRNNETIKINKENIVDSFIIHNNKIGSAFRGIFIGYEYLCVIYDKNKRIYITNFYFKINKLIENLKISPTEINCQIPYIDRGIGTQYLNK